MEVEGIPIPYTIRNDATMTALLIACFIILLVSMAHSRRFLFRQARLLVFPPANEESSITETSAEVRFQIFMMLFTSLQIALLQDASVISCLALTVAYFIAKGLVYTIVNNVFFSGQKNVQYIKSLLFLTAIEGVLLYPAVLLQAYFQLNKESLAVYVFSVVTLVKILTFYKCYKIFFVQKGSFIHLIVYLCALEIAPLAALWTAMGLENSNLGINI